MHQKERDCLNEHVHSLASMGKPNIPLVLKSLCLGISTSLYVWDRTPFRDSGVYASNTPVLSQDDIMCMHVVEVACTHTAKMLRSIIVTG